MFEEDDLEFCKDLGEDTIYEIMDTLDEEDCFTYQNTQYVLISALTKFYVQLKREGLASQNNIEENWKSFQEEVDKRINTTVKDTMYLKVIKPKDESNDTSGSPTEKGTTSDSSRGD